MRDESHEKENQYALESTHHELRWVQGSFILGGTCMPGTHRHYWNWNRIVSRDFKRSFGLLKRTWIERWRANRF